MASWALDLTAYIGHLTCYLLDYEIDLCGIYFLLYSSKTLTSVPDMFYGNISLLRIQHKGTFVMHYLHDVHKMNAYRADNVCMSVHMI